MTFIAVFGFAAVACGAWWIYNHFAGNNSGGPAGHEETVERSINPYEKSRKAPGFSSVSGKAATAALIKDNQLVDKDEPPVFRGSVALPSGDHPGNCKLYFREPETEPLRLPGHFSKTYQTQPDGYFSIDSLTPGKWDMLAACEKGMGRFRGITVKPAGETAAGTLRLEDNGSVSGYVLENFIKKPVAGAKVSLFSIAASREDSKETEIIGAVTEENGSYKISGVIEGSYTLKVSKPGYRTLEIPSFSTPGNGSLKVAPLALSPGADPLPEQDEPQAADKPSLTFGAGGFHVSLIHPGSQAGKAGMRDGDVIFSINGKTLDGMPGADAKALLGGSKGDTVLIGVLRDGERIELNVPLRLVSP